MSRGRDRDDTREPGVISGLSSKPRNDALEDARDDSLSRAGGGSTSSDLRETSPGRSQGRNRRQTRDIVRTRSKDYSVSREDLCTMEEIGRFRILDTADLALHRFQGNTSRMNYEITLLEAQGLLSRFTLRDDRGPALELVSLTRAGKRLFEKERKLCGEEFREDQQVYAGFVKPAELRHDAAIYRMYQAELSRLNKAGCRVRRVVLDYELKRSVYASLSRARSLEADDYQRLQQEVALKNHLKFVEGKIPLPDLRIEYETREGDINRIDLEVATEHYKIPQRAEKSRAGFTVYLSGTGSSAKGTVRDERELTAEILSI